MTLQPTQHEATAAEYALISTDRRFVAAVAQVAHANGYPILLRTAQPMAELYAHLSRIWNAKAGTKPFSLPRKDGLWKQVDQQYLADGLIWSVKTVSRNLLKLERAGLIRYARHGYISKKYVQLLSLELALSNAAVVQMHSPYAEQSPADTQVSITYRTRSPLGNGHDVRCLSDMKSVANTERLHRESNDIESNQELSPQRSCEHPVPAGKKVQIIQAAVAQFEARQQQLDGPLTDGRTVASLLQQTAGWSDHDVAHACGVALHLTNAWAWIKGNPSAANAGTAISAAINGRVWSPVPGITCTSDVAESFSWNDDASTFVDSVGYDLFDREVIQPVTAPSMAPTALDKADLPPSHLNDATQPVETLLDAPTAQPCPVNAFPLSDALTSPLDKPIHTVLETHESRANESADQLFLRRKQLALQSAQHITHRPGRYGTPISDDLPF
jgi:hypothetical protein